MRTLGAVLINMMMKTVIKSTLTLMNVIMVTRMMAARWWEAGLAVSLLFTVPTAYLLFPNPVMPDAVPPVRS